jgi:hypothetical protein
MAFDSMLKARDAKTRETLMVIVAVLVVLSLVLLMHDTQARRASMPKLRAEVVGPADESPRKAARRRNFASAATRCPVVPMEALQPHLKSQDKEDVRLLGWFNGLCQGTYIEMGGLNGVRFSNTYGFNKGLGWKGLLVEASPANFQQLVTNRPDELATVHAAVCDEKRTVHYYDAKHGFARGIWEFSPPSFREKWWKGATIEQTTPMECMPLRDILEKHVPNQHYFDFFSLDIEGAEFMALQSLDFDQVGFGIIFVEADGHNELKNLAVRTFLESKGYRFMDSSLRSYWFVNEDFGMIYKDLLSS